MRGKTNQWKGGPKSSLSYKMDMFRKAKDEKENPKKGWVKPHYAAKPKGGFTIVKGHKRRS